MKKILILSICCFFVWAGIAQAETLGRILLRVESKGEAWYVHPLINKRYYLGRPNDAFEVMRSAGVGITNSNLNKIPVAEDSFYSLSNFDTDKDGYSDENEIGNGYNPYGEGKLNIDLDFATKHLGKIFLQVESKGEAWYINPVDKHRHYLGRPTDAFNLMRNLGLGITNSDIAKITVGDISKIKEEKVAEKVQTSVVSSNGVPFIPQAPFGNWADQRQEDGCEEVSAIMAVYWSRGKSITLEKALEEILAISAYEEEKYGTYHDTSAKDTGERILKGYFNFTDFEYREDFSKQDLIDILNAGKIAIIPVNGIEIGNPYFTQPGPPRHMLVVIGYDSVKKAFITNDPGTKRGKGFQYPEDRFFDAIRDYQTGTHIDVTGNKKAMIVIN